MNELNHQIIPHLRYGDMDKILNRSMSKIEWKERKATRILDKTRPYPKELTELAKSNQHWACIVNQIARESKGIKRSCIPR